MQRRSAGSRVSRRQARTTGTREISAAAAGSPHTSRVRRRSIRGFEIPGMFYGHFRVVMNLRIVSETFSDLLRDIAHPGSPASEG